MRTRREFIARASAAVAVSGALAAEPDPALVKAMEGVRAAIPLAETDPDRPVYHFRPPANWTNDPNGTIFYRGWHHLFYQLNPFASRAGSQHWGHARSKDLVNWEHLPVAIWPSSEYGERAIFSGGAILAGDGRPRLIYTSIGRPQPEQWMMAPKDDDLIAWDKYPKAVLTAAAHGSVNVAQWRDPFLFREAGQTYMVCGGNVPGGRGGAGQVLLYRAAKPDLTDWKHLGAVFNAFERETFNIECPNLFKLDGRWVLIFSPHRPCEYYVGDLDLEKVRFTPYCHGVLDPGDAYASNISTDDRGRTILWLWGRTNTPQGKGWGSVMTLPRILSIGPDGFLRQQPAPEFASLRGEPRTFPASDLAEKPVVLEGVPGDQAELEAEFSGNGGFGFELRRSTSGKPGGVVSVQRGNLSVGNVRAYVGNASRRKLCIFLDKRSIEVYLDDGIAAVYNPVEAAREDQGVAVIALPGGAFGGRGGAFPGAPGSNSASRLESLRAWPLRGAAFSLEHFHV
jgi:sucrose-6-phosphate hydrolase SacC (GH32 family)